MFEENYKFRFKSYNLFSKFWPKQIKMLFVNKLLDSHKFRGSFLFKKINFHEI